MRKKRIVVVCPGRGSYTRKTSNYLENADSNLRSMIEEQDKIRSTKNLKSVFELDKAIFRAKTHMSGENASPLIYSCSLKDYSLINKEKYEIAAICGNSMGWYIAMALSGALTNEDGFDLIQTMGILTQDHGTGGQIIYPIIDEDWRININRRNMLLDEVSKIGAHLSIKLGGFVVIGGKQSALNHLLKTLPTIDKYPFQIPFHAAFHTRLIEKSTSLAQSYFDYKIFNRPRIPLVDGRGNIWSPWSTDIQELFSYTLGDQIVRPYDFSSSIDVAVKEFCPDQVVLLGPGNSLGSPVAQVLIENNWNGLNSKSDFLNSQEKDPFVISMGIEEQRNIVL